MGSNPPARHAPDGVEAATDAESPTDRFPGVSTSDHTPNFPWWWRARVRKISTSASSSGLRPRDHGAADARLDGDHCDGPYVDLLPDPRVLEPALTLEVDQEVGAEAARAHAPFG